MKKNKIFNFLSIALIAIVSVCIGSTNSVNASSLDTSYFWGITVNFDSQSFDGTIVLDDDGKFDESYHSTARAASSDLKLESLRIGGSISSLSNPSFYKVWYAQGVDAGSSFTNQWVKSGNTKNVPSDTNPNEESILKFASTNDFKRFICKNTTGKFAAWDIDNGVTQCTGRERNAIYTWPGVTNGGDATSEDEAMLNWVNATLISEYNKAISFVLNKGVPDNGSFNTSSKDGKRAFLDMAAQIAVAAQKKGNYTINMNGVTVSYKTESVKADELKKFDMTEPGTENGDYVKYTIGSDSIIVRWKVPKGYGSGQRLSSLLKGRGWNGDTGFLTTRLTFEHVCYQAMFNYYLQGQTSLSIDQFYAGQADWLDRQIAGFLDGAIKGVSNMLGLYSFEEMMLNQGRRGISYWQGVVPATWFTASNYFYLFTFSLSMIILLIALVRLAFTKSLSTIGNVARKVSLMEGIKQIIIASVVVVLFQPIFYVLCQLNASVVLSISGLVKGEAILNTASMSGGTVASMILAAIFFYVNLRLNFTYMLRGITILLCYLVGPICIMLSTLGEKYSQITSNWAKELFGNLFIQSIHALILMLFININRFGANTSIEKLVLVYSFIPLTEFIRTNLFALGKGMDDVAGNLAQTTGAITGGIAGAGLAAGVRGIGKATVAGGGAVTGAIGAKLGHKHDSASMTSGSEDRNEHVMQSGRVGAQGASGGNYRQARGKTSLLSKAGSIATSGIKSGMSAIPGMVSSGIGMTMGFASGAANTQGRADGFQLHRGISEAGRAANEVVDSYGNYYNESQDNAFMRQQEYAENTHMENGFNQAEISDVGVKQVGDKEAFIDNHKMQNTYSKGEFKTTNIQPAMDGKAISSVNRITDKDVQTEAKYLAKHGDVNTLAKYGITNISTKNGRTNVTTLTSLNGGRATPHGQNVYLKDVSNADGMIRSLNSNANSAIHAAYTAVKTRENNLQSSEMKLNNSLNNNNIKR